MSRNRTFKAVDNIPLAARHQVLHRDADVEAVYTDVVKWVLEDNDEKAFFGYWLQKAGTDQGHNPPESATGRSLSLIR